MTAGNSRALRDRPAWEAWRWPAFAVLTITDAVIIHLLPPARAEIGLLPAAVLAAFGNLVLVLAVAPWVARRLAERGQGAGGPGAGPVALLALAAGALGLLVVGLASRPLVVSETDATEKNAGAVREWVAERGTVENRRNLETANTIRLREGYFRTCVASDDRRRPLCLFVDTKRDPPVVRRDPTEVPNAEFRRRTDYP